MSDALYRCIITPNVRTIRIGGRPRWLYATGWKARAALKYFYGKEGWFGRERYLRAAINRSGSTEAQRAVRYFIANLPKWRRHVIKYPRKPSWTVILNRPGRHLIIRNFNELAPPNPPVAPRA